MLLLITHHHSIVGNGGHTIYSVRHINFQRVNVKVHHLFSDPAELAYAPVLLILVRAVPADHREDVAKLIHALEGGRLVLVAYALDFLRIISRCLFILVLSHFVAILLIINFPDSCQYMLL